ncbi:hypothetical protein DWV87_06130 [Ruminococcus sp. AF13-28]|nr:hypothetical protein DWV90_06950 [Ruminococcus sp. AF13-37]RGW23468.1 hypothetical protein DWV87_06130 [Ruminococcus sp. AF13-28]
MIRCCEKKDSCCFEIAGERPHISDSSFYITGKRIANIRLTNYLEISKIQMKNGVYFYIIKSRQN